MQGQRGRHVQHLIHLGLRRLGHPPTRVGRQRFQIPAGALCIQYAKRQGRFSRARHPRDPHDFVQGNIYVNIFQIVYMGIPNADCPGLCPLFCFFFLYVMFVHSCLVFFFMIQFAVCSISQTRTTLLYAHYT